MRALRKYRQRRVVEARIIQVGLIEARDVVRRLQLSPAKLSFEVGCPISLTSSTTSSVDRSCHLLLNKTLQISLQSQSDAPI